MIVTNNLSTLNGYAKSSTIPANNALNCSGKVCEKPAKINDLPSFAWKANMLPFGAIKMSVSDFKEKMQTKIDNIRAGTHQRKTIDKAEALKMKEAAFKNITGPLLLECKDIEPSVLADVNKKFSEIKNLDDLYNCLDDPRIPEDKPILVTEPYSENYASFMKEVKRGNETGKVKEATEIVEAASNAMQGDTIEMPEIAIKVSKKDLLQGLIKHIQAGLDYEPLTIAYSPYLNFSRSEKNEISVDLVRPVYER